MLPKAVQNYYESHNVHPSDLTSFLSSSPSSSSSSFRFVRVNPHHPDSSKCSETLTLPIPWLPAKYKFFALPSSHQLNLNPHYKSGALHGIDVSSGACVAALLSSVVVKKKAGAIAIAIANTPQPPPLVVLDLCCSPGMKTQMIVDFLPSGSHVVGVDVSEARLNVTRKLLKKYQNFHQTAGNTIQLFLGDGTLFGCGSGSGSGDSSGKPQGKPPTLFFDSRAESQETKLLGKRKKMNKSARGREKKRLDALALAATTTQFDLVLVDAECSTDGSIAHLKHKSGDFLSSIDMEERQAGLPELQIRLLQRGFDLVKVGGAVVYSTCSLSEAQNESVVEQFLKLNNKNSSIVEIEFENFENSPKKAGSLAHTVRFQPNIGTTNDGGEERLSGGGFFISKIVKTS